MPKRGENIYKRKDGRWEGRYLRGRDPLSGKALYSSVYDHTYKGVKDRLFKAKSNIPVEGGKRKYKEWLEYWLEHHVSPYIRLSSYSVYKQLIDNHISPELGQIRMEDLSTMQIQSFIQEKIRFGRLDGSGPLSEKTVKEILQIIKNSLKAAVNQGLISTNSAIEVKCPQGERMRRRAFSLAEQRKIEQEIMQGKPIMIGVLLCLYSGLRLGELCALTWEDIDVEGGFVSVNKSLQRIRVEDNFEYEENGQKTKLIFGVPKSKASIRQIPICTKMQQEVARYYKSLPFACRSNEKPFISIDGRHIEPRLYQKYFSALLRDAGINKANFHTLRHTFATRCIELNVDVKTLSQILGHSSVGITLDTYVHSLVEQKRKSMDKLNSLMNDRPVSYSGQ